MTEHQSRIARRREAARLEGGAAYTRRRQEIVAASASLFKDRGYDSVKLGDIADALGTDRASLYYYYGSKDEVFRDIVRETLEVNVKRAETVASGTEAATEKLALLVSAIMNSYEREYPFLYVFIQEDLNRITDDSPWSDEVRELAHRYDGAVVSIIEQGIAEGCFEVLAGSRITAFAIIGMINWTHRWFKPGGHNSAAELSEIFTRIVLRGISS